MKNIRFFFSKNFLFLVVKFSRYLNLRVFVMGLSRTSVRDSSRFILSPLIGKVQSRPNTN